MNMEHSHKLLAILLVVGLNLSTSTGDSSATWEDFQQRPAVWADKKFAHQETPTPKLFRQLTSAVAEKAPTNDSSNSTSGGGGGDWIAQCQHLSDDLEQSWNLTIVVVENNWPVVEDVAKILYNTVLNCDQDGAFNVMANAKCLIHSLDDLKNVLLPAVKMNFSYAQDAWKLIPKFVNATKECFTF